MQDLELWHKIEEFNLDEIDIEFPFSKRLARDNGWDLEYTNSVINEYKKFIYLICTNQHPCTPSDQIDQVWHLHLVYTKSYWKDFCGDILNRDIHHGPTKGGQSERNKYKNLYNKTIESYAIEFGEEAPTHIWPPSHIRFTEINFRRINSDRYWVFPRRWFKPGFISAALGAVIFTGCKYGEILEKNGTFVIIGAIALFYIGGAIFKKMRKKRRGLSRKSRSSGASGCSDDFDSTGDDSGCSSGDSGCSGCGGD